MFHKLMSDPTVSNYYLRAMAPFSFMSAFWILAQLTGSYFISVDFCSYSVVSFTLSVSVDSFDFLTWCL
jgi:hypothetical protein